MTDAPRIPDHFHFVFGLRPQVQPFHLMHYLCLRSCIEVNRPAAVYFHTHHLPWGPWWDAIAPQLTVLRIEPFELVSRTRQYERSVEGRFVRRRGLQYAHHADFLRLQILLEHGGVYADMDTLFLRPIPREWFRHDFVLGREHHLATLADGGTLPTLSNAFMLGAPEAAFAQRWFERMHAVFDGTWNRHSCVEAAHLARAHPGEVTVLPESAFSAIPPTRAGMASLFEPSDAALDTTLDDALSVHLCEHLWGDADRVDFTRFHRGLLTVNWIRRANALYARLARPFLPADPEKPAAPGTPGAQRAEG